jgi:PLP dependent protein
MARFVIARQKVALDQGILNHDRRTAVSIQDNIKRVEDRIEAACRRSGRRREDIRLVAVSKTHPAAAIREAHSAGISDFGENRVQEATAKSAELADLPLTWHMLGHLQSNKAKSAREVFQWVQSVDSIRLAEKLALSSEPGRDRLPVLIEVNLGGETSKTGLQPAEVSSLVEQIAALTALEIRGLMTIPPFIENAEEVRPYFRQLRDLATEIGKRNLPNVSMNELSMGMSHDFEVAIEEGATIIRVGTDIFGSR